MSKEDKNSKDKKIIFLGNKELKEIPAIIKSTDIFVNPSYSEGLPTSVMEACAGGCAIVATDVGGTNEIITDGVNGFLYEPKNEVDLENKIKYLIENPDIRKEFGEKAKLNIVKEYSWDKIIIKWKNLIEEI